MMSHRQLTQLAHDLPLGAVYFQRVKRSVARLEAIGALRGIGAGRSRRFLGTPCGFASLILNLRILRLDPTTDGSEFELKRALVTMWNLVFDRLSELPDEPALDSELEIFFDDVQALKVLGKPAITDELVRDALDILGLIELQRERVAQLLDQSERRLEQLPSRANLFRSVDLAQLIHDPATATAVRSLATSELPELNLRATAMRYQHYLTYLVAIHSDVTSALTSLHRELDGFSAERAAWRDGLHAAYLDLSSAEADQAHGAVDLSSVVRVIADTVGDEAVLLTDSGSFARWVHQYYRFSSPRRFAGPVSGAMGYAVPCAIGAALVCPEAPVIAFVGDGGFMMTGQELTTAAQERLNTTIIVCDNQAHGSILYAQWQQFNSDSDYATRLASPDFVAVARAYGVPAWRVERSAEFPAVLQAAMDGDGPSLLHLVTDQRDIVPGDPEDDVV